MKIKYNECDYKGDILCPNILKFVDDKIVIINEKVCKNCLYFVGKCIEK